MFITSSFNTKLITTPRGLNGGIRHHTTGRMIGGPHT
jgi:hypothetical protein